MARKGTTKMSRGRELAHNKTLLLNEHNACELCQRDYLPLNVHHRIPVALGGSDKMSNLIVVCERCHALLHAGNRPELTRLGIHGRNIADRHVRLTDLLSVLWVENASLNTDEMADIVIYLSGIKTKSNAWVSEYCEDTCDGPRSKYWFQFIEWANMRDPDYLKPFAEEVENGIHQ